MLAAFRQQRSPIRKTKTVVQLYLDRSIYLRLFGFSILYVAQGIPIGLLTIAVPAWLVANGADAADVGYFVAITGLPWAFKLVAGPFMDRFAYLPMGRRRPWVLGAQSGLVLALVALAFVPDPANSLWTLIVVGFVINAFAAVQDVAVDGMAIDVLPASERGRANAFMAFGQVLGFSAFGALSGYLLSRHGMAVAAVISALTVGGILAFATLTREREGERLLPWTDGDASPGRGGCRRTNVRRGFKDLLRVMLLPMSLLLIAIEFLSRAGAGINLAVFPVIGVDELGFSSEQYSYVIGIMGGLGAFVGIFFGPAIDRKGAARILALGLVGGAITAAVFASATSFWSNTSFVVTMLAIAQIFSQAFFVSIIAVFMGVCWTKVAATQFAIYMSLANLARSLGAWLFAFIAADVTSSQALYLMAGLWLVSAVLLRWFDPQRHQDDLASLERREAALGEPVASG